MREVTTTGGRDATERLAELIAAAQRLDPFAPVTVVVPSNYAALSTRRVLASTAIGGRRAGLTNITFVTAAQLAELVAGPGREPPLTPVVLAAAVRAELAGGDAAAFAAVAGHRATERALAAAYTELRRASPQSLATLAESPHGRTRAVARFVQSVAARLAGFADERAVAERAALRVDRPATPIGTLVCFQLDEISAAHAALLDRLGRVCPSVSIGFAPDADRSALTRIGTAIDSDDEVRHTLREVMRLIESGTPLHRIAILYTAPEPYARIVREQLQAAGIPHNGPGIRRVRDSVVGRLLSGLIQLEPSRLSRDSVIDLVSSTPSDLPATEWDRLSREAGVVGGVDDWTAKLDRFSAALDDELGSPETDELSPGKRDYLTRRRRETERLAQFVRDRADAIARARSLDTWSDLADFTVEQLTALGSAESWPERERELYSGVVAAIERLAALDEIDAHPGWARFAEAIEALLDDVADRIGRFGHGVLFLPVALAHGLDLDAVFVVGAAEGLCPLARREDALIPDRERAPSELVTRTSRIHHERRAFLAAIAAGRYTRSVSYARGDGRSGRARLPSRWLLAIASDQLGRHVASDELDRLGGPLVDTSLSFVDGLRRAATPVSLAERDLHLLELHAASGLDVRRHHLAAAGPLARGYELMAARSSDVLTRFDGIIPGGAALRDALDRPMSPSRLERWATCPMRYLLGDVLRLSELAKPEDVLSVQPLDRGTLLHEILERFLGEQLDVRDPDYTRLRPIADEVFADYEARGLTGRPILWRVAREQLLDDLARFAVIDRELRAETGARTARVEFEFGFDSDPLVIELGAGRSVRFRGRIDRVDTSSTGVTVYDYKTGRMRLSAADFETDPVQGGQKLQLAIYAAAVREKLGAPRVEAHYWHLGEANPIAGIELDEAAEARAVEVIASIAQGIEQGVFPAVPAERNDFFRSFENCRYCDFDRLCPRDRDVTFDAKASDERLVEFSRLAEPRGSAEDGSS